MSINKVGLTASGISEGAKASVKELSRPKGGDGGEKTFDNALSKINRQPDQKDGAKAEVVKAAAGSEGGAFIAQKQELLTSVLSKARSLPQEVAKKEDPKAEPAKAGVNAVLTALTQKQELLGAVMKQAQPQDAAKNDDPKAESAKAGVKPVLTALTQKQELLGAVMKQAQGLPQQKDDFGTDLKKRLGLQPLGKEVAQGLSREVAQELSGKAFAKQGLVLASNKRDVFELKGNNGLHLGQIGQSRGNSAQAPGHNKTSNDRRDSSNDRNGGAHQTNNNGQHSASCSCTHPQPQPTLQEQVETMTSQELMIRLASMNVSSPLSQIAAVTSMINTTQAVANYGQTPPPPPTPQPRQEYRGYYYYNNHDSYYSNSNNHYYNNYYYGGRDYYYSSRDYYSGYGRGDYSNYGYNNYGRGGGRNHY